MTFPISDAQENVLSYFSFEMSSIFCKKKPFVEFEGSEFVGVEVDACASTSLLGTAPMSSISMYIGFTVSIPDVVLISSGILKFVGELVVVSDVFAAIVDVSMYAAVTGVAGAGVVVDTSM